MPSISPATLQKLLAQLGYVFATTPGQQAVSRGIMSQADMLAQEEARREMEKAEKKRKKAKFGGSLGGTLGTIGGAALGAFAGPVGATVGAGLGGALGAGAGAELVGGDADWPMLAAGAVHDMAIPVLGMELAKVREAAREEAATLQRGLEPLEPGGEVAPSVTRGARGAKRRASLAGLGQTALAGLGGQFQQLQAEQAIQERFTPPSLPDRWPLSGGAPQAAREDFMRRAQVTESALGRAFEQDLATKRLGLEERGMALREKMEPARMGLEQRRVSAYETHMESLGKHYKTQAAIHARTTSVAERQQALKEAEAEYERTQPEYIVDAPRGRVWMQPSQALGGGAPQLISEHPVPKGEGTAGLKYDLDAGTIFDPNLGRIVGYIPGAIEEAKRKEYERKALPLQLEADKMLLQGEFDAAAVQEWLTGSLQAVGKSVGWAPPGAIVGQQDGRRVVSTGRINYQTGEPGWEYETVTPQQRGQAPPLTEEELAAAMREYEVDRGGIEALRGKGGALPSTEALGALYAERKRLAQESPLANMPTAVMEEELMRGLYPNWILTPQQQ